MQQQSPEQDAQTALEQGPIVCPLCWDHVVERIEGVTLSANNMGGRAVTGALIYHCSQWHIFAVFERILA